MHSSRMITVLVSTLFITTTVQAHDFWIEPSTFHPSVNSIVQIGLRIGHQGQSEPMVRDASRFEKFVVAGPRSTRPVLGRDGGDPAGLVRVDAPGLHVIGYRSKPTFIELQPALFEQYLRHEGLDRIVALRAQRDETQKPGREVFSRCAKSLLVAGGGATSGYDRVLGFRLELVPESDPIGADRANVSFRVLFDGKACPDVLVSALCRENPANEFAARSNDDGRVGFRLQRKGVWFLNAVHMVPATSTARADWESLWASLTFERRPIGARQTVQAGSTDPSSSATPIR